MHERAEQFLVTTKMLSFAITELERLTNKKGFDFAELLPQMSNGTDYILNAKDGISILLYIKHIIYRDFDDNNIPDCLAPVVIDGKIDTNILTNITSTFINIAMVNCANRKSISPKSIQLPTMEDINFAIINALETFQDDISS